MNISDPSRSPPLELGCFNKADKTSYELLGHCGLGTGASARSRHGTARANASRLLTHSRTPELDVRRSRRHARRQVYRLRGLHGDHIAARAARGQGRAAAALPLPLDFVQTRQYAYWSGKNTWQPLPLVTIIQSLNTQSDLSRSTQDPTTHKQNNNSWNVMIGDIMLPHNIKNLSSEDMGRPSSLATCLVQQEDRQHVVIQNHVYIERPLQATYTAGIFFFFKNAVVRDVLPTSTTRTKKDMDVQMLALDGNVQDMKVVASVPSQNALITIAECVLLVCGLAATPMLFSDRAETADPFQNIVTPHGVARVLLDGSSFPPVLLHRRVAVDGASGAASWSRR